MTLAANLTFLFDPAATWERIDAAADAGFEGVEMLQPYAEDAEDLRHTLEAAGPSLVLINTPEPKWDAGGRGHAADPGAREVFRKGLEQALAFAEAAACPRIHILAGRADGPAAAEIYLENLTYAADRAPEMAFTIEPLNTDDQPGYFLNDFSQAVRVLETLDRPNFGLQFDSHHAARITGDASEAWARFGQYVTHVQIAGPGRGTPGADEIALIRQMRAEGYAGWISAEYTPPGPTEDSLGWMAGVTG